MDKFSPIPVPRAHRWREFRIKRLPAVIFFAAFVAVIFVWKEHVSAPSFVGEVETVRANVISTVPGLIVELTVDRFDKVSKGQIIGRIFPADPELLKASLAAIEIDLKTLQARVDLDQNRNEVNYEQVRLAWLGQRVELATAKVNLEFAESEFRRQSTLHREKIVSDSEFELAKNLRDARQEEVAEKSKVVSAMESRLKELSKADNSNGSRTNNLLGQAIAAQEARFLLTEGPVALKSPIDGVVSAIEHRVGEKIMAGLPIVSVTSSGASRILAFARQPLQLVPKVGDRVQVRTRSSPRKIALASVLHVGSGIEQMVLSTSNSKNDYSSLIGNPLERGLAFSVNLPEGLAVYPGETVDLLIVR